MESRRTVLPRTSRYVLFKWSSEFKRIRIWTRHYASSGPKTNPKVLTSESGQPSFRVWWASRSWWNVLLECVLSSRVSLPTCHVRRQRHYHTGASPYLDVSAYVAELGIFCGVWSRKSEHRAISAWGPVDPGADGFQMWNAIRRITWLVLGLTNRNAFIRCRGEELGSSPANWQWGTGVSVGRHCLEVMRRLSTDVCCDVENWTEAETEHVSTPRRFCELSNSRLSTSARLVASAS
jgi:hypothetical protein